MLLILILLTSLVSENLFKGKEDSKFNSDIEPTGSKEFHHRVLFLSGYGLILITVDIRYSTDNEKGYIRIGIEKNNKFSTPASTPPPTRSPTPPPPSTSQIHAPRAESSPSNYRGIFSRPTSPSPRAAATGGSARHPQPRQQSPPIVTYRTDPFLLLKLICEALPAREEETTPCWKENPAGTYLTETPHDLSSAYLGHPTTPQNPFIPLRNLFDIESELQSEKNIAELSQTPTLLSLLIKLLTIEEDISCDHATINLLDMLASLRDLFPILQEVPSSTASPTPSSLFEVKEPVGPSQDQISKETPVRVIDDSFIRPQWSVPRVVEEPQAKRTR
ncbi:hypothetical protein PILCRDRAFT_2892, partial [Piloderma croceum F 1598]